VCQPAGGAGNWLCFVEIVPDSVHGRKQLLLACMRKQTLYMHVRSRQHASPRSLMSPWEIKILRHEGGGGRGKPEVS
jgi:hypothetical protein